MMFSVTVIKDLALCLQPPEFDRMYFCVCMFLHYSKAVKQIIEQEPGSLIFDVNNSELFQQSPIYTRSALLKIYFKLNSRELTGS